MPNQRRDAFAHISRQRRSLFGDRELFSCRYNGSMQCPGASAGAFKSKIAGGNWLGPILRLPVPLPIAPLTTSLS